MGYYLMYTYIYIYMYVFKCIQIQTHEINHHREVNMLFYIMLATWVYTWESRIFLRESNMASWKLPEINSGLQLRKTSINEKFTIVMFNFSSFNGGLNGNINDINHSGDLTSTAESYRNPCWLVIVYISLLSQRSWLNIYSEIVGE